jgi:CRISPR-associated protein Cmr3
MDPLDVLFFRDGRPFGGGMRGSGGLPTPRTLAGALRTRIWGEGGFDFNRLVNVPDGGDMVEAVKKGLPAKEQWRADVHIRGPWLYDDRGTVKGPVVSMPGDLLRKGKKSADGEVIRLRPTKTAIPGWSPLHKGMVPLWHHQACDVERAGGYLAPAGLEAYLNGKEPDPKQVIRAEDLFVWEERTGIAVDGDKNSAEDQMLYSARFLRLARGVCLYAEVELPDSAPSDLALSGAMPLGGEGRRVSVTQVARPFAWPVATAKGDGVTLLTVTPGIFRDGWAPDGVPSQGMVSASVPGSVSVSGWDMARHRPKPNQNAVMAGSVYFYNQQVFKSSPFVSLCADPELNRQGWGMALQGVWNHA